MDDLSVKKLARDLDLPVAELIKQLQDSGSVISAEDDMVTGEQQLRLLKQIKQRETVHDSKQDISIADLQAAPDLVALNDLLTKAMAQ